LRIEDRILRGKIPSVAKATRKQNTRARLKPRPFKTSTFSTSSNAARKQNICGVTEAALFQSEDFSAACEAAFFFQNDTFSAVFEALL